MLMKFANDTKLEGVTKKKKKKDKGLIQRNLKVGEKPMVTPPPTPPKKKQIKTYKNICWKKFNLRKK